MRPIRVLVVDDSLTVRKRLVEILAADPQIEVVGEAGDGKTAITLCERHRPDVVTLDMMLPVLTGLAVTEHVMAHFPTPILIVSASTNRGELFKTYDALSAGALDVLEKPGPADVDGEWEQKFVGRVKLVSRIKVITHLRAKLAGVTRAPRPPSEIPPSGGRTRFDLVAIGASTGGPAAIHEILRGLPADFPLPILLVIHIAEGFGVAFAEWLDGLSPLRVTCAREGEPVFSPGKGRVVMAPANAHLVVHQRLLHLSHDPERHSCRPSVDVLFESLAREAGSRTIGCLLSGMGRDGAAGLLALRRAGAACIAQDEATSVVYGMPREAALLGAAQHVLPLPEIARTIVDLAREGRR